MRMVWFGFAGSEDDGSITVTPTIAIASPLGVEPTLAQAPSKASATKMADGITGFA
jgi:hypothetical protein